MEATLAEQKSEIRIMDVIAGDLKLEWSKDNDEEIKAAKKAFHSAKKKGMLFYKQKWNGKKGQQITEFDPDAERIVGVPMVRGG